MFLEGSGNGKKPVMSTAVETSFFISAEDGKDRLRLGNNVRRARRDSDK